MHYVLPLLVWVALSSSMLAREWNTVQALPVDGECLRLALIVDDPGANQYDHADRGEACFVEKKLHRRRN